MISRFTLTEVKELVYQGFETVTPERWQALIKHVHKKVEDHYWEADGLNEELLERFIINNSSDSDDSDDTAGGDINDDSSTSFGSKSSSLPTSSDEVQSSIWCYFICIVYFRNDRVVGSNSEQLTVSQADEVYVCM